MMINSLILFAQLLMGFQSIPQVKIEDKFVLEALSKYDKQVKKYQFDDPYLQSILLRIDTVRNDIIVYMGATQYMGYFTYRLPDSYAQFKNRTVFIYSGKIYDPNEPGQFTNFYDQFKNVLAKNVLRDGKPNPDFLYPNMINSQVYRMVYRAGKLIDSKQVAIFPDHQFNLDFTYNEEGQLMYKDGVFHIDAIEPYQLEPDDFGFRQYILDKTNIPLDTLRKHMVSAKIVVDERGKIVEAIIDGLKDQGLINELREALYNMPPLNPANINGKPVKVRIDQRI